MPTVRSDGQLAHFSDVLCTCAGPAALGFRFFHAPLRERQHARFAEQPGLLCGDSPWNQSHFGGLFLDQPARRWSGGHAWRWSCVFVYLPVVPDGTPAGKPVLAEPVGGRNLSGWNCRHRSCTALAGCDACWRGWLWLACRVCCWLCRKNTLCRLSGVLRYAYTSRCSLLMSDRLELNLRGLSNGSLDCRTLDGHGLRHHVGLAHGCLTLSRRLWRSSWHRDGGLGPWLLGSGGWRSNLGHLLLVRCLNRHHCSLARRDSLLGRRQGGRLRSGVRPARWICHGAGDSRPAVGIRWWYAAGAQRTRREGYYGEEHGYWECDFPHDFS